MEGELTRALLLEEVASRRRIADALYASVKGGVPLLTALVATSATTTEILARYLARSDVPVLRLVAPVLELVDRLPPGLCERLLALPVRRDGVTGTVDVVVAHPADPHAANELAFHLAAPVRVVRASVEAIEEALYKLRLRADGPAERFREAAASAARELGDAPPEDERIWDSRPRASEPPPTTLKDPRPRLDSFDDVRDRLPSLPAVEPELLAAMPFAAAPSARRSLMIEPSSSLPPAPPPGALPQSVRVKTPAWGTPIHRTANMRSDPPSSYGSEIPIPLTRKTMGPAAMFAAPAQLPQPAPPAQPPQPAPASGGTRRPPSLVDQLGEGYAFDGTGLRDIIERPLAPRIDAARIGDWARPLIGDSGASPDARYGSFIPGPPPVVPGMSSAPRMPFPEMGGVLAALRNAGSRDEVLELVLTASRMVALKVALFVVKKGGYRGWVGSPELGGRAVLQSVLVPLEAASIFNRAVREDIYLGPLRNDEIHAPLVRLLRGPSRDVAAVPVRVSGKTAVIILADELGDTMIATRRLEELAKAAGEAFARVVRARQR